MIRRYVETRFEGASAQLHLKMIMTTRTLGRSTVQENWVMAAVRLVLKPTGSQREFDRPESCASAPVIGRRSTVIARRLLASYLLELLKQELSRFTHFEGLIPAAGGQRRETVDIERDRISLPSL